MTVSDGCVPDLPGGAGCPDLPSTFHTAALGATTAFNKQMSVACALGWQAAGAANAVTATCGVANNTAAWVVTPSSGCSMVATAQCPSLNGSIVPQSVEYNHSVSYPRVCADGYLADPASNGTITCRWKAGDPSPTSTSTPCLAPPSCSALFNASGRCHAALAAVQAVHNWTLTGCDGQGTWLPNGTYVGGGALFGCSNPSDVFTGFDSSLTVGIRAELFGPATNTSCVLTLPSPTPTCGAVPPPLHRAIWISFAAGAGALVVAGAAIMAVQGSCRKWSPVATPFSPSKRSENVYE